LSVVRCQSSVVNQRIDVDLVSIRYDELNFVAGNPSPFV
jgi:hypothetical protein